MIRINLIGGKVKARKSGGSGQFVVYLVIIAAVFGGLYLWHQQQADQLQAAKKKAVDAADKVESLKRVKQTWEAWQVEKAATDAQTQVFEMLQADQIGPAMALQYLSYALTASTTTRSTRKKHGRRNSPGGTRNGTRVACG